jgi:hypothetical protein
MPALSFAGNYTGLISELKHGLDCGPSHILNMPKTRKDGLAAFGYLLDTVSFKGPPPPIHYTNTGAPQLGHIAYRVIRDVSSLRKAQKPSNEKRN